MKHIKVGIRLTTAIYGLLKQAHPCKFQLRWNWVRKMTVKGVITKITWEINRDICFSPIQHPIMREKSRYIVRVLQTRALYQIERFLVFNINISLILKIWEVIRKMKLMRCVIFCSTKYYEVTGSAHLNRLLFSSIGRASDY